HRVTSHVENAAQHFFTNRNGDRSTSVHHLHAAAQTVGGGHCNGTNPAITKVLLNFANHASVFAANVMGDLQCVVDFWKFAGGGEIHVHHGTDDLDDSADVAHDWVVKWRLRLVGGMKNEGIGMVFL